MVLQMVQEVVVVNLLVLVVMFVLVMFLLMVSLTRSVMMTSAPNAGPKQKRKVMRRMSHLRDKIKIFRENSPNVMWSFFKWVNKNL